ETVLPGSAPPRPARPGRGWGRAAGGSPAWPRQGRGGPARRRPPPAPALSPRRGPGRAGPPGSARPPAAPTATMRLSCEHLLDRLGGRLDDADGPADGGVVLLLDVDAPRQRDRRQE